MADAPKLTRAAIERQLAIDGDCTGCVALQALLLLGDAAKVVADSCSTDCVEAPCPDNCIYGKLRTILDAMDWTAPK